jgi:hypothetical protein
MTRLCRTCQSPDHTEARCPEATCFCPECGRACGDAVWAPTHSHDPMRWVCEGSGSPTVTTQRPDSRYAIKREFVLHPLEDFYPAMPSKAVVAADDDEHGVILWDVGTHVPILREGCGRAAEDLGLLPPSAGIWVWEGETRWIPGGFECPQDGEIEADGNFRPPTDEEWAAIRKGECPWDFREWLTPEAAAREAASSKGS